MAGNDAVKGSVKCRRLSSQVAIVTASTAGIGLGIARRLAEEGASVVISSRRQSNVDETVKTLRAEGFEVAGTACHVGDREHLENLIKFTLDTYGRLDILVSNAAVNPSAGPLIEMDARAIDKILDINSELGIAPAAAALTFVHHKCISTKEYGCFN